MKIIHLYGIVLCFFIFTIVLLIPTSAEAVNWYNTSYKYRVPITLQSGKIATTSSAYPILATTTLSTLAATSSGGNVQFGDGRDIVFVANDNSTLLNFEQESYASSTGAIVYWVDANISSTTNEVIYMYYGNSTATNVSTTTGVWDDYFKAVWHLQEDPSINTDGSCGGGVYEECDSTQYGNHLEQNGSIPASASVNAQVAKGVDLAGSTQYFDDGTITPNGLDTNRVSVSGWVNPDVLASQFWFSDENVTAERIGFQGVKLAGSGNFEIGLTSQGWSTSNGIWVTSGNVITQNVWEYVAFTYDKSSTANDPKLYINGARITTFDTDSNPVGTSPTGIDRYYLGQRATDAQRLDGTLDEFRYSTTIRHPMDILTDYNNQVNVDSFMTFGSKEVVVSGTVYTDEGTTNIGANKTIAISVNGGATATTTETSASGTYSLGATISSGDTITVFLDDETQNGTTVTVSDGATLSALDIYQNRIIARHDNNGSLTNALFSTADNGDTDIDYSVAGGVLTVAAGNELFIPTSYTFAPAGAIIVDDIDINGTLTLGSNSATVSGTWDATGGTVTTSATVTFTSTASETITTNTQNFTNLTFNGTGGIWTFGDRFTVGGALTLTNGNLIVTNTATVTGAMTNTGGYLAQSTSGYIATTSSMTLDKASYIAGNTITITLTDPNRNTSATSTESATTTITIGADSELVTLTENTVSSGIFVGTLLTSNASATVDNGTLELSSSGIATSTYTDIYDSSDTSSTTATINIAVSPATATASSSGGGGVVGLIGSTGLFSFSGLNPPQQAQKSKVDVGKQTYNISTNGLTGPFTIGAKSKQAKLLQEILAQDTSIYPEGFVTGFYGQLTKSAVERFQIKYGITTVTDTAFGYAGPKTRAKIKEIFSQTVTIESLQKDIIRLQKIVVVLLKQILVLGL